MLDIILNILLLGNSASIAGSKGVAKFFLILFSCILIGAVIIFAIISFNGGVKHSIAEHVKEMAKAETKEYIVNKKNEVKEKFIESKAFSMIDNHKKDRENKESTGIQSDSQKDHNITIFDKAKLKVKEKWEEHKDKTRDPINSGA